jgi:large subunit ribosomal protein L22
MVSEAKAKSDARKEARTAAKEKRKAQIKSFGQYIRIAPRKLRVVGDLVRGKKVQEALDILKFTPRYGAIIISKLVGSAVANATQRGNVDVDTLVVQKITIDEGPTLKRSLPRAQGRVTRIRKKTSHVIIELDQRS